MRKTRIRIVLLAAQARLGRSPLCTLCLSMTLWRWSRYFWGCCKHCCVAAPLRTRSRTAELRTLRGYMQISLGLTADLHKERRVHESSGSSLDGTMTRHQGLSNTAMVSRHDYPQPPTNAHPRYVKLRFCSIGIPECSGPGGV